MIIIFNTQAMIKCQKYSTKNYTKHQLGEIIKLLPEKYSQTQKKEIAISLIDLANIYLNTITD